MATRNGTTISGSYDGINVSEHARLTYTTSTTNTQVSVTFTLETITSLSNPQTTPQTITMDYRGSAGGQIGTGTKTKAVLSGSPARPGTSSYELALISNKTITYARTKSDQTKTLSFSIRNNQLSKESTGSVSISVPKIPSYSVTYNANTGSGTVASQTKWYGENLVLQSSGFTKTNYTLIGWNTIDDGSGQSYTLGAIYSTNAPLSLYAQWKYNYQKPTISNLSVFRVDSPSATSEKDDGTYIRVSFDYLGGTFDNGTTRIQPSYEIFIDGGSAVDSGVLNESGTYSHEAFGVYSVNTAHTISVRLYDDNDIDSPSGVRSTDYVSASTYPLDILADGSAMGVMIPAIAGQKLTVPDEFYISSTRLIYVVEDGTSDGWKYRKWSDGRFELWKYYVGAPTTGSNYSTLGNLYGYRLDDVAFPTECTPSDTEYHVSATWAVGNGFAMSSGTLNSQTLNKFALYCLASHSGQTTVKINIYVTGKWK